VAVIFICGCEKPASALPRGIEYVVDNISETVQAPRLVKIPKGVATIGGKNFRSFQNEEPIQKVKFDYDFYISETEITFEQYDLYCKEERQTCPDDQGWGRGDMPVINVNWYQANGYAAWLSKKTGKNYRLPSESEWEYAARAGTNTKFWWGDEYITGKVHCDRGVGGCPEGTDQGWPAKVKSYAANPFGLYDMTSNVAEWVQDCSTKNHKVLPLDGSPNPHGNCSLRTTKGSDWGNPQPYVHLSKRVGIDQSFANHQVGFRVVRDL